MAGHPLRPATDQSLGEPLPRQQANRPRAPPPTPLRALNPAAEATGMSCGISPPFGGLSPFGGQVTHVLRTRAPCAGLLYCYSRLRTRLACVKHAASVRSEPGSNSRLKLVVLKSKNPAKRPGVISERTFENIARLTHKPNGFWHVSFSCQRTGFLSGRKATADSNSVTPHSNLSRRNGTRKKLIHNRIPDGQHYIFLAATEHYSGSVASVSDATL